MADDAPNITGSALFRGFRRAARPSNLQAADEAAESVGLYLSGNLAFLARVRSSRGRLPVVSQLLTLTLDSRQATATSQLRDHLLDLGGGRMPRRLWTCIQSPGMVLQSLRIPRVRPSAMVSAAFWTLKKERSLHTDDTVFDIELLRTVEEEGIARLELLAVAVPKEELDDHQQFNAELGTQAVGVTSAVFAFRNFLRLGYPELHRSPCAILFVNDASSDVFVFDAGQVLAVRTLRTGLDSLRDTIVQTLDIDAADPRVDACLALLADKDVDPAVFGEEAAPSVEDVFGWGRPVARRLARNIQRTLHAFEDVLENGTGTPPVFLVAGTITRYPRLVQFLGDQIGLELVPFTPAGSEYLRQLQGNGEEPALPEASGMSLAVGLALADAYHTPNLLFTYEDRLKLRKRMTVTRALRVTIAVLLVVLVCSTVALRYYLRTRSQHCDHLRSTVATGAQEFDKKHIMELSERAIGRQVTTKALAEAYFAPAVIAEISSLTPTPISLLEIRVDFASASHLPLGSELERTLAAKLVRERKKPPAGQADVPEQPDTIRLEGVVCAPRERLDALLAEYVFRLQRSPFFATPQVTERKLEQVDPSYLVFGEAKTDHLLFFTLEARLQSQIPAKAKEEKPKG